MSRRVVRLAPALALLLACSFSSPALAKNGWFGADRPGATLFYGDVPRAREQPNPETIQLLLRCADKGKAIVLFVAETSAKVKPGTTVRVGTRYSLRKLTLFR